MDDYLSMTMTESNDILRNYKKLLKWGVLLVAIAIYANTANHEMALDDYSVIETHTHVQNGIDGIGEILTTNYRHGNNAFNDGLYRPLSLVSFALEKEFFDSNTSISHLLNLLIYGFSCFFLFLALEKLLHHKALIIPLSAALLFVCHPLHTEIVSNIKGRDELLAFLGFTLCLFYLIKTIDSNKLIHYVCSILFFVLALFSKESAVTYALAIPVLLLLKKEVTLIKAFSQFLLLIPFALGFIALRYLIINGMSNPIDSGNFGLLNNPIAASADTSLKWGSTFALQVTFLQKTFFPLELIHDYSYHQLPLVRLISTQSILGILILLGLIISSIIAVIKRNVFGIIAAFYLIAILVASQIFATIGIQFAERMLFLAVLAFALLLPLSIEKLLTKSKVLLSSKNQKTIAYIMLGIGVLFSLKTFDRNKAWKNNLSLYQADITSGSNSARVNYNLGTELNEQAQVSQNTAQKKQYLDLSIQYLSKAIDIYPEYLDAYNNLGLAYKNARRYSKSHHAFLNGIKKDPNYSKYYFNLATVYYAEKNIKR
ncbi:MAG: hypothetical protein JKY48_09610 [Flavobacteriales bacterium]|nr:hypothetical protein [Flavobacteriales bacterium]